MKRKIALLAGTFLTLLVAFAVYHFSAGGVERLILARRQPAPPASLPPLPPPVADPARGPAVDNAGTGLVIEKRDERGRLEGIYLLPEWEKQPDGSYLVRDPNVVLYHKGGQRTYVHARRGELFVQDLARGVDVRSGRLWGDVKVALDPQGAPEGLADASHERLRQLVRIHTEEVQFDNDRLMIRTDSRVTLFSAWADVYGTGLTLRWREQPQELVRLEIHHGELMAVYQMPQEFNVALPGGAAAEGPTGADEESLETPPTASSAPEAASRAASGPDTQPGQRKNVYRMVFRDRVRVDYPIAGQDGNGVDRGYLRGADVLSLTFDWVQDANRDIWSGRPYRPAGAGRSEAGPVGQVGSADSLPAAAAPATGPGEPNAVAEPMIITWTGPLVLEPVGYTDRPSSRRFRVEAEGRRVVLSDSRSIAECGRFAYAGPDQRGFLERTDGQPARMVLGDGQELACPRMEFDGRHGSARLVDWGYMARRRQDPNAPADLEEQLLAEVLTDGNEAEQYVRWSRAVEANFVSIDVVDAAGRTRRRQVPREADFFGDVELAQGGTGDYVRSQSLHAVMAQDANGRTYVRQATATGNVRARQEGADLTAETASVTFRPSEDANAAQSGRGRAGLGWLQSGRLAPETLAAEGNVVFRDEAEGVVAQADRLNGDLTRRTVTLYGAAQPAEVAHHLDRIIGDEIRLWQEPDATDDAGRALWGDDANLAEWGAAVVGPGRLEFLLRKDMSGRELANPRPVQIAWRDGMDYGGRRNEAEFRGHVQLDSNEASPSGGGGDHMSCRKRMRVLFEKPEATTRPASAPAVVPAGRSRSALGMEDYSKRRIAMIIADDQVVMQSSRLDDRGRLLRRLKVTGEQLVHDANSDETNVFGTGTLLAEDYRPPELPSGPATAKSPGGDVPRPHQTGFWWEKVMSLSQKDGVGKVVVQGNVQMVHRSGVHVLSKGLNVPDWPGLKGGRVTKLRCEMMDANFAERGPAPASRPATRGAGLDVGPRIGELDRFFAVGDVRLEDGERQKWTASCQHLEYDRALDMVTLLGHLPGRPPTAAAITYKDLDGRRQPLHQTGSKIVWYRKTDTVKAEDVSAGGVR